MRKGLLWFTILALAGCSKAPDGGAAESDATAPTGISVTAAPGVAFAYRYAFRLPPTRIAATQEAHAQMCEKLGVARCRITGMRYQLFGENDIRAMLAFKLDPSIARGFGKDGIALAQSAKGTLVDAEITGTDAGAAIDRATVDRGNGTDALGRIDAELAKPGRSASERAELQAQRAEAARRIEAARADIAGQRESLATTPMQFDYESGSAIRGFDASAPITSALDTGLASIQTTFAVLLGIVAIFGPPALALLLILLAWRRFGARLPWRRAKTDEVA